MWKLIVAGLVLALAGCETTVVLRNPETGAMTQCTTEGNRSLLARRESSNVLLHTSAPVGNG